jgi:Transposase
MVTDPLAATNEHAPLQSAPQSLARRCKGSDALEYQKAGRLARRATCQALFDKIRELYNAGRTVSAIARVVGFGRKSVARWVRLLVLPARNSMMPKTQSTPAYHEAFLLRRWAEGITNGRRLFGEILQRGYSGSYSHLARLLAPWREVAIAPKLSKSGAPLTLNSAKLPVPVFNQPPASASTPTLDPTTGRKISPLMAAALCVKPRGQMTPQQIASVDALKIASAEFTIMRQLAMRFRGLLMGSSIEKLDVWLQDAQLSGVYAMHRFARAARQDIDAVRNAVLEPWSNVQTEGQINRLKTIKRAICGRPPMASTFLTLRTIWSAAVICPASVGAERMSAGLDEIRRPGTLSCRRALRSRPVAGCSRSSVATVSFITSRCACQTRIS